MRALPLCLLLSGCILGWDPVHDTAEPGECGDNVVNGVEDCDGTNLDGQNCESVGFFGGALGCDECGFDTSSCTNCGDGTVQSDEGELCDEGEDNDGRYDGCTPACTLGPYCGDGDVDSGFAEQCDDGDDLNTGEFGGCSDDCSFAPTFELSALQMATAVTWDVAMVNLDGDADLDLVLGLDQGGGVRVYINEGGTFPTTYLFGSQAPTTFVALGELDGNAGVDCFVGNGGFNLVAFNDGSGTLTEDAQRLGDNITFSVQLGDVDGDTDLDVVTANGEGGSDQVDQVWLNDGSGRFSAGQGLGATWSTDVAVADLDGDLDLDLFYAVEAEPGHSGQPQGAPNRVFLNDGSGGFVESSQRLGDGRSMAVELGDLDDDGDLDAFVVNGRIGAGVADRVWINDGAGNFTSNGQSLGTDIGSDVALGDVDNDGDLDALVVNLADGSSVGARLWLNDGSGQFVDSGIDFGATEGLAVALGDLDGDGDLDAYIGKIGTDQIWLNTLND